LEQYRTRYWDFTVKHFHEPLQAEHGFRLSYTWTKTVLQSRGLVRVAPQRSAHCKRRPRRPLPGIMLFHDGSRYEWLAGQPALEHHDPFRPPERATDAGGPLDPGRRRRVRRQRDRRHPARRCML
jgi:hypothetical protein